MTFQDNPVLGRFTEAARAMNPMQEEIRAAYEHIAKLESCLAELVGIYWGEGDGIEPAPQCIQRAWEALGV